jgi:hypothetical protein
MREGRSLRVFENRLRKRIVGAKRDEVTGKWRKLCNEKRISTSQQDFVPRKVYCVSNVTFHAESKYEINIFSSPAVFVQWHLLLLIFRNFIYFLQ